MPPNKNFMRLLRDRLQGADAAHERAEVELRKAFELLRDAIDSARAAGLSWADVARRLRTDPRTVEGWFREP